ncbi:MAG TPA: DUF3144 domain-containing protein [Gallionellaceae bacterium]|nr:DUF3144 domain-containing protein [Gallionellaceae bacterium]
MSDNDFFDAVDAFLNLANELNRKLDTSEVSTALMYATARYNAFNFFATDGDIDNEFPTFKGLCEQYQTLLQKNMVEMRKQFEETPPSGS